MRFWTWMRERIGAEQTAWRGRHKLRKSPSRPTPRFRPRLEALEDRCVPSTLAVTNSGDDVNVQGTLRYDVAHAQSGDTILLTGAVQSGIVLTQGELVLNQNVTITSGGDHQIMISGNNNSRVFEVAAGTNVTLANLAITDGNGVADNPDGTSQDDGDGGGILNFGTLTVSDSTLSGNSAGGGGGGIFNVGTLMVSGSTLSGNSAFQGGGIFNAAVGVETGTVTVSGSTLSDNSATSEGGGIFNEGTATLTSSTLSGNSATQGGGIFNNSGTLTVNSSTISGNNSPFVGADLYLAGGVLINNNSTISDHFP
jgi:hypothetical protein